MTTQTDVLKKIYFDRSGFGSMQTTYKDAKEKDNSITMNDVKDFFEEFVEKKKQLKGFNSFIAPHHNYEYQADLFFINDIPNQDFKLGMLMIDVFSKYMTVIPMKSKAEGNIASAILEGFQKMDGHPKILYTDDEPSLSTIAMNNYFKEKKYNTCHNTKSCKFC